MGGTSSNDEEQPRYEISEVSSAAAIDDNHAISREIEEDSPLPLRESMEAETSPRYLRWVPRRIRRISRILATWSKGPQPPQPQTIKPWFPVIQEAPIRLLNRFLPKRKQRFLLLMIVYAAWAVTFGLVLRESTFATDIEGFGEPISIGCGNTLFLAGNECGVNGNGCRPFNGSAFAFRCPGNCISRWALNPRAVGAQEVIYQPFVIGGPPAENPEGTAVYRGDSYICGAAIHAGTVTNAVGGCGVVATIGQGRNYSSTTRHGITSVGFDSHFPISFSFSGGITCEAKDLRWSLLAVSLTFTVLVSLFTTSPPVFFFTMFAGIFAHVGFASDPPGHSTIADLFSNLLGKFLPAMFIAFVIYKYPAKRALSGLTAQVEKTFFWVGGCWVGALTNYTFDWIPIQRLTGHDLQQQPGAQTALAAVIIALVVIVFQQIYYFRLEGRLLKYLGLYGFMVACILISLTFPGLSLRIHHYIMALLLVPGTSLQTRPSLLYQGILLGLFINGIARWGFAPILETPDALQGDAQYNSLLPTIETPLVELGIATSNITFSWPAPPSPMDGVSILVNDVERFRGYGDEGFGSSRDFVWERDPRSSEPEYFRFAFMEGTQVWDYTKAGTWLADGTWKAMDAGPSRIKRMVWEDGDRLLI